MRLRWAIESHVSIASGEESAVIRSTGTRNAAAAAERTRSRVVMLFGGDINRDPLRAFNASRTYVDLPC